MSDTNERSSASIGSGSASIPITPMQKRELVEGCVVDGFTFVSEETLYMDSHGVNVTLVVVEHESGGLYGFVYGVSSEDVFFNDYPDECVPLVAKDAVQTQYYRADGRPWMACI